MAAGADCVFPFGLTDLKTISELVAALRSPLNIVGRAGMLSIRAARWGPAIDFRHKEVRRYFTDNALYWLIE